MSVGVVAARGVLATLFRDTGTARTPAGKKTRVWTRKRARLRVRVLEVGQDRLQREFRTEDPLAAQAYVDLRVGVQVDDMIEITSGPTVGRRYTVRGVRALRERGLWLLGLEDTPVDPEP